ncbi:nonribosomal peptide synthetase [Histoplasma capsulatum G186AR]|uniref:Nonribosomal peptide synthetase n=2 Tax=Ajellomyces capsulatus TaxID=5037 RepID=C0P0V3_AJECG|nr:nonribosomal peptide synthetase [Histoplasma capsulatum G186AR]EEH02753.1 nonribosomal peptide synthetase [Histoplasma capsulatum G186AR]KAG5287322.1 nonribosomal peptide synthetase [Histoplasma capsulatum]QSS70867.1 nonribosomal peptide synthetase [Histoplasma capsulatum G186AR]
MNMHLPACNGNKVDGNAQFDFSASGRVTDGVFMENSLLFLKGFEDQIDLLVLAWTLFLYRDNGLSDDGEFSWSLKVAPTDENSILKGFSSNINEIVLAESDPVTKALASIRARRTTTSNNEHTQPSTYSILFTITTQTENGSEDLPFYVEALASNPKLLMKQHGQHATLSLHAVHIQCSGFMDILDSILKNTDQTIRQAMQLGDRELQQLWKWNASVPQTLDDCIHDIFVQKARRDPSRQAVVSWDGELSYGEVDQFSTLLAIHLIKLGVKFGNHVLLCFEKSMWTVVAVLAVMKSGGTLVLTDPSQPEARLQTIATEVGANLMLTSERQEELGKRILAGGVIVVNRDFFQQIQTSVLPPASATDLPSVPGSSPLYTIFTSGSTGKPKGVVISHANYTSGALPRAEAVGYGPHSRVLDFPSYAFDVSIDCMLCTLAHGGCVCVPSEDDRVNNLSGAIRNMKVNMAHMTPSVARVLGEDTLSSLEVLGLGGESVSVRDAANWGKLTKVIIAYGPSECTVGCTINNEIALDRAYTSIGKGVGGVTWVVDPTDHNRLMPIGAIGELIIEGPIVGRGYLNDPERTSSVFIEDPMWLLSGCQGYPGRHGRFYKTGDLVKYDPDGSGSIVFVGRGDQQVKLRGQRVELGEVEHHLRTRLPAGNVVAAEVITPGGKGDQPTLVAFIAEKTTTKSQTNKEIATFSTELRHSLEVMDKALGSVLPRYMVPAAYIPLLEMPLLVSCKVDRKKLRSLGSAMSRKELIRHKTFSSQKEPQSERERQLAHLWKGLFGAEAEIDVQSNFFDLGGDSLMAMKLVAAARAENLLTSVADIFRHPTLAELAITLKHSDSEAEIDVPPFSLLDSHWKENNARIETAKLCGIDATSVMDVYPCTPLQEGLMALSAKVSEAYVAQRVVELANSQTAQRLQRAFETAAADSPILRTRIVQVPGHGLMQVVLKDGITWRAGTTLEEYLVKDRNESMGLGTPLARFAVTSNETTGKVHFVLTIHHALYDGWSMPLVVRRVNRAFNNQESERSVAFNSFIKHLSGLNHKDSEIYWKEQLQGANGLQFPALPRAGYQTQAQSLLEQYFPLGKTSASCTSIATSIRAAWALVVGKYTLSDDVVFGETLTGRNAPVVGIEKIEGPMITTVPVRVRFDRNTRVSEYLRRIHDGSILRIPHEHMGLQHIRRLSPDAREACELRTGIVIHPTTTEDGTNLTGDGPANGFVPAGDEDAAREALKFNTYALMLVCSLDPKGFLVMASFDSATIDVCQMDKVLGQFGQTVQQLCENGNALVSDLLPMTDEELAEIWRFSNTYKPNSGDEVVLGHDYSDATATWIVAPEDSEQLVPLGGIGELVIEGDFPTNTSIQIGGTKWLSAGHRDIPGRQATLHKTGQLAKYNSDGSLVILGGKGRNIKSDMEIKKPEAKSRSQVTTPKQQKLRKLWARVLGISEDEVGSNDSFFDLGGDSISAMKLVSEGRMENLELVVMQVFQHRRFHDMADIAKESLPLQVATKQYSPFSTLDVSDVDTFISESIHPSLMNPSWKVVDVLPARPLQEIAVDGTINLPRYSARYELFYLDAAVDQSHLFKSCQELISRNEILRTIFVKSGGSCFGVVIEELQLPLDEYQIDGDLTAFAEQLCGLDIQTVMPLGSPFIKFFFVQSSSGLSCLIMRISHAQYDEICLPILLRQLSALYEGELVPAGLPFSSFVHHIVRNNIPQSIEYWRRLLQGSSMSVLRPSTPLISKKSIFISKTFDISSRSKEITLATLPTAAWALCLARRLSLRDVTFGEVVSGRNIDFANCDTVVGPTWQYIPVRVKFKSGWTVVDLLNFVQHQHISSTPFEGIGLKEIVRKCTDWPETTEWFDSVVHQDVEHVESLRFLSANSRMDTIYPHLEPLREWKIQAFPKGDSLCIEIVTFESWRAEADSILNEMGDIISLLVTKPNSTLFRADVMEESTPPTS